MAAAPTPPSAAAPAASKLQVPVVGAKGNFVHFARDYPQAVDARGHLDDLKPQITVYQKVEALSLVHQLGQAPLRIDTAITSFARHKS